MYLLHKIIIGLVWLSGFILSYIFSLSYSSDAAGQVLTVLSIFFGFYVTSASMMARSEIYKALHKQEDRRKNKRLSHTLRDYYKFGFISLLIGIVLFLIISLLANTPEVHFDNSLSLKLSMFFLLQSLATAQLCMCLAFCFVQTRLFIVLFGNEAYFKDK